MLRTLLVLLILAAPAAAAGIPFVDAVKTGDRTAALAMLEQQVNVNAPEPDGTTALHYAVHRNDAELVRRLIQAGANVNAKNDYGSTPMSEAAILGNAAIMEMLLEAGADVESPNADGQTALMAVARTGNLDAARVLIRHGANVNAKEQWRQQTALMWAVAQRHPAIVKELIAHGADVNARSMVNNWQRQVTAEPRAIYRPAGGWTPLLYAAREGCVECARHLVEGGANINLPDPEGVTPLLLATLNQRFDTANYLIDSGAGVNRWDWFGRTPLYIAVDLNTIPRGGRPDQPALDETTSFQIIQKLLAKGANPNAQLKLAPPFRNIGNDRGLDGMLGIGTTPLLRAAKAFDAPVIKLLLEYGANTELTSTTGILPVQAAAGLGSTDADTRGIFTTEDVQDRSIAALDLLLKAGADINSKATGGRNTPGQTPLHGAAFWGWNKVVQYLVDHGADLHAKDARGRTPMDSAMGRAGGNSRGGARIDVHQDTADLLEKLIAESGSKKP